MASTTASIRACEAVPLTSAIKSCTLGILKNDPIVMDVPISNSITTIKFSIGVANSTPETLRAAAAIAARVAPRITSILFLKNSLYSASSAASSPPTNPRVLVTTTVASVRLPSISVILSALTLPSELASTASAEALMEVPVIVTSVRVANLCSSPLAF